MLDNNKLALAFFFGLTAALSHSATISAADQCDLERLSEAEVEAIQDEAGNLSSIMDCSAKSCARAVVGCEAVVMVVRHAEDDNQNGLTKLGQQHAKLYTSMFEDFVYGGAHNFGDRRMCVCPIKTVLAISSEANSLNIDPTPNPHDTVAPLANDLGLGAPQTKDNKGLTFASGYEWCAPERAWLTTLLGVDEYTGRGTSSTVIGWDKAGMSSNKDQPIATPQWSDFDGYIIPARDPGWYEEEKIAEADRATTLATTCSERPLGGQMTGSWAEPGEWEPLLLALPRYYPLDSPVYHKPQRTEMFLFAEPEMPPTDPVTGLPDPYADCDSDRACKVLANSYYRFKVFKLYKQYFATDADSTLKPWQTKFECEDCTFGVFGQGD